jgi:hypothetical protein
VGMAGSLKDVDCATSSTAGTAKPTRFTHPIPD